MSSEKLTSRRWKEIDCLYAIGFILVLIGHSHPSDWSSFEGSVLRRVVLFVYTFHMPLFFFVAGFLFQNSDSLKKRGYRKWIADKALRLLTPYFFWSLIALVPKYYLEHRRLTGIGQATLDVFINPRAGVWGHFWFLPTLFLTYAIFGALRSFVKSDKRLIAGSLICAAIIYFLPIKTGVLGLADLRSSLTFFSVGMAINLTQGAFKKLHLQSSGDTVLLCFVTTIVCVLLTDMSYRFRAVGLVVALLMIPELWVVASMLKGKSFSWIGERCFTLYVFSWFFQATVMLALDRFAPASTSLSVYFFLMFAAGLAGPVMVIAAYDKLEILHTKQIKLVIGAR